MECPNRTECDDATRVRADLARRAAALAHDFSNVVLAIRGYAELIRLDAGAPAPLQGLAGEIACACERATELTRRLDGLAAADPPEAAAPRAA